MIKIQNVSKIYVNEYRKSVALDKVSLELPDRGLVVVTGHNGCGKSTLLNLIGGIDIPTEGNILYNNIQFTHDKKFVNELRKNTISYIFQSNNLINNLTVGENLKLVCEFEDEHKIDDVLTRVGMLEYKSRLAFQLSLGQQQRIAIARALLKNNEIILADEPTASLDKEMSIEINKMLIELSKTKLVIFVTHNFADVIYYDRHIKMEDGKVIEDKLINDCSVAPAKKEIVKITGEVRAKKTSIIVKNALRGIKTKKLNATINIIMLVFMFTALFTSVSTFEYSFDKHFYKVAADYDVEYLQYYGAMSRLDGIEKVTPNTNLKISLEKMIVELRQSNLGEFTNTDIIPFLAPLKFASGSNWNDIFLFNSQILKDENIIGRKPTKTGEVVISQYIAECYIYLSEIGILEEKFLNYDDILEKLYVDANNQFVELPLKVVGIEKDDLTEFQNLKKIIKRDAVIFNSYSSINEYLRYDIERMSDPIDVLLCKLANKFAHKGRYAYVFGDYDKYLKENLNQKIDSLYIMANEVGKGLVLKTNALCEDKVFGEKTNILPLSFFVNESLYNNAVAGLEGVEYDAKIESLIKDYLGIEVEIYDKKIKIEGFYDDYKSKTPTIYLTQENNELISEIVYQEIIEDKGGYNSKNRKIALVKLSDIKGKHDDLIKNQQFQDMSKEDEYGIFSYELFPFVDTAVDIGGAILIFAMIICGIIFAFTSIFVLYSIAQELNHNRKNYGVLKSLGINNRFIGFYSLAKYIVFALIAMVISVILSAIILYSINYFVIGKVIAITVQYYKWYAVFAGFVVFGLLFGLSWLHLRRVTLKKPPIKSLLG